MPCLPPGELPNPGIEPRFSALQVDSLPSEPPGKPKNTGVGSLPFLQRIFPTQESNRGLLHCRQILYHLSHKGSPIIQILVHLIFSKRSLRLSCSFQSFYFILLLEVISTILSYSSLIHSSASDILLLIPGGSEDKASACNTGDPGLIPESGRSSREGNGNLLQYSCLENPRQRSLVGYSPWDHKESDMIE